MKTKVSRAERFPRVTIGIPTHNNLETIARTLESVVGQTYPNLDVIVSNDCSTDGSIRVIEHFAKESKSIRIINQSSNLGLYENMAFVLSNTTSPYFMWLAGDDYISDDFVTNNVNFLEANLDFIASSSVPVYLRGEQFEQGKSIHLACEKTERVKNFLERPYASHNVYYSLIRTNIAKGFPFLGFRYAAADWVFDLFLIGKGKINTSANGNIFLGTSGVSTSPNANRKFRTSIIEVVFPMWPMSRDMLRLGDFQFSQKLRILQSISRFNLDQLRSDIVRFKNTLKDIFTR